MLNNKDDFADFRVTDKIFSGPFWGPAAPSEKATFSSDIFEFLGPVTILNNLKSHHPIVCVAPTHNGIWGPTG